MVLYKPALFSKEQIKQWVSKNANLLQQFTNHFTGAVKVYSYNYREDEKALAEYSLVCTCGERFTFKFDSFESFVEELFRELTTKTEQWGTLSSPFRQLTTNGLYNLHPLFLKFCKWWLDYALELRKDAFDNFYGFRFTKIPVQIQKVYGCRKCRVPWHFDTKQQLAEHYFTIHKADPVTGLELQRFPGVSVFANDLHYYGRMSNKVEVKPAEAFKGYYITFTYKSDPRITHVIPLLSGDNELSLIEQTIASTLPKLGFREVQSGVWVLGGQK